MGEEEPAFTTAAEMREEADDRSARSSAAPNFTIPEHPERRYSRGGVEYKGGTIFLLTPDDDRAEGELAALVEQVLGDEDYRYGDWFDLPLPLFLVHDDATNDTFRVAVRDDTVEFHVRPETKSEGLRALYDRLTAATDCDWHVEQRF